MFRSLTAVFEERDQFLDEYHRNLSKGGLFIPTLERFGPREVVDVSLDLRFCGGSLELPAEVVSCVAPELQATGVEPGVAVHLLVAASELRELVSKIADVPPPPQPPATWPGRPGPARRDERSAGRVDARVEAEGAAQSGHTRNLSRSGVLIASEGEPIPVGRSVRVALVHPTTGDQLELDGQVVRHVQGERGDVTGLAIEFALGEEDTTLQQMLEHLRAAAHARELGAISGPIETVELANLTQLFSACSQGGTLRVTRGDDEGRIVFEAGALRNAAVRGVRGPKALARLIAWEGGTFSFAPVIDPTEPAGDPLSIGHVMLESLHQVDELRRLNLDALPPSARVTVAPAAAAASGLDPIEVRALGAAAPGASVAEVLDALPDFDAQVYRALLGLRDRGLIEVERE